MPENHAVRDPSAKNQHLDVCLGTQALYQKSTGFERFAFTNEATAGLNFAEIDTSVQWFGRRLQTPLMIAPMTGGVGRGHTLNMRLAAAAERWGLPMGVGSQRIALEDPNRAKLFAIRDVAPTTFIFSNLGAAQVALGWGADQAMRAIEMVSAQALFVHLNPLQEACQGGDVNFSMFLPNLSRLCEDLSREGIPVLVREVGFGLSVRAAKELIACGVAGLDCAGAGGTSWAKVEALCSLDPHTREVAATLGEWGIPTADAIHQVRTASRTVPLIATGGITDGLEVAKALALGADLAAMARAMLLAAEADRVDDFIRRTIRELQVCMFAAGARTVRDLRGLMMDL